MKIYLTKSDVLVILAKHFDLLTMVSNQDTSGKKEMILAWEEDELCWEGNKEQAQ